MDNQARIELPARVRSTALEGIEAAKEAAAAAGRLAAALAGAVAGRARADADELRAYIDQSDVPAAVRRPVPLGPILAGAVAVGIVIYLVVRRPAGTPPSFGP
jgi:hypothetical protein